MLKHVVFIKLQSKDEKEKKSNLQKLKTKLDKLPDKIEAILSFETGINVSKSPAAFDISLISTFESEETLDVYRKHPAHVEVLEFINSVKETVAVVDYKLNNNE